MSLVLPNTAGNVQHSLCSSCLQIQENWFENGRTIVWRLSVGCNVYFVPYLTGNVQHSAQSLAYKWKTTAFWNGTMIDICWNRLPVKAIKIKWRNVCVESAVAWVTEGGLQKVGLGLMKIVIHHSRRRELYLIINYSWIFLYKTRMLFACCSFAAIVANCLWM